MSKIYRICNDKTQEVYKYFVAENDTEAEKILQILVRSRKFGFLNNKYGLSYDFLEETEKVDKRLAFYQWPHISRVTYLDNCYKFPVNKIKCTRISNVVDWLVEMFSEATFRFEIGCCEDYIYSIVYEKNIAIELYKFRSKNPYERIFMQI